MTRAQKTVLPLGIASIVMFISLFFGTKIAGIGLLIWVLILAWTMNNTMFSYVKPSKLIEINDDVVKEKWKNKNYAEASIRFIAIPMSFIGLIVVFVNILLMIFVL